MTPELLTEQERLQCSNQGKRYPVLAKLLAAYEALVQQVAELTDSVGAHKRAMLDTAAALNRKCKDLATEKAAREAADEALRSCHETRREALRKARHAESEAAALRAREAAESEAETALRVALDERNVALQKLEAADAEVNRLYRERVLPAEARAAELEKAWIADAEVKTERDALRAKLGRVQELCASVNGKYQHPDQLEQAMAKAFDAIREALR